MNSIARALNNIAAALQSISNEMKKNKADVVVNKSITSNPYSGTATVTAYASYASEGWMQLSASEKEQLFYIYKAIMEKAVNPNYTGEDIAFNKAMDNLRNNWPTLHKPIEKLVALKERSILNKKIHDYYPKKNKYK